MGALFGNRAAPAPSSATGTIAVTQANHTSSITGTAALPSIVVGATSSGENAGGGSTCTITFPTNSTGDYLLLILSLNQTAASVFTSNADGTVDAEVREVGTRRVVMLKVSPVSGAATCVLTKVGTAAVWSWVCLNLGQITPTAYTAGTAIGSNGTAAVAMPTVTGVPTTDGHELQVMVVGVNSDVTTWVAPATPTGQTERRNYVAAPSLYVVTAPCAAGATSFATADISRTSTNTRNETALVAVFA